MKGFIATHRGFEHIACKEAKELVGAKAEPTEYGAIIEVNGIMDLCILAYKSQSSVRVMNLLFEFPATQEIEETVFELKKNLADTDLSKWLPQNTSFKVECSRKGEHEFTSQELMLAASRLIADKTNCEISLESADTIFYIQVCSGKGYFGIDFGGMDLSKREYRIFSHPSSTKGTIAYCLARSCGYDGKGTILDPFTKSGMVPIESALMATNTPVNYYRKDTLGFRHIPTIEQEDIEKMFKQQDSAIKEASGIFGFDSSMANLSAAQKNSKLAGVNKSISFSRLEIDWLDTKFQEGEIDFMATVPPEESKRVNLRFIDKLYKELFYQIGFILSKKGAVAFLARDPTILKKHAQLSKFLVDKENETWIGKEKFKVLILKKN